MSASVPAAWVVNGTAPFAILARRIFSLNSSIEWVLLNETGFEECWAWRNPITAEVCTHASNTAGRFDPLPFILSQEADGIAGEQGVNPYRPLFVVLAYDDILHIIVRAGVTANVSVAVPPDIDGYTLGRRIVRVLDGCAPGAAVN